MTDINFKGIVASGIVVVIGIIAIVGLTGLVMAWSPVDEGNVGVVTQWGDATGEVLQPGSNYIQPVRQKSNEIPTRPQTVDMQGNDEVFIITKDGQDVWVSLTVRYSVNKDEAVTFFRQYKNIDQVVNRLIIPTVTSNVRNEASDLTTRDVITREGRLALEATAEDSLRENFDGSGLQLEAVQVREVRLNDEFASKLEAVEIERTERERALIEANTTAEEEVIVAEGQAEANRVLSESLDDAVLTEQYINAIKDNDKVIIAGGGEDGQPIIIDPSKQDSSE
jgi:regulator of protease activity HflC (stomatin/prohibitin superfamily)